MNRLYIEVSGVDKKGREFYEELWVVKVHDSEDGDYLTVCDEHGKDRVVHKNQLLVGG